MTNRAHLYRLLQDAQGNVVTGVTVTVYENGTTTPLAQTLYVDDASAGQLTNPFSVVDGTLDLYLDKPQRVSLMIQIPAQAAQIIDDVDVVPPAGFVDSVLLRAPNGTTFWRLSVTNDGHLILAADDTVHTTTLTFNSDTSVVTTD